MKKNLVLLIVLLVFLGLAACSAIKGSLSAQVAGTGANGTLTAGQSGSSETTLALQLALGTLKLNETSYPIDAEQAGQLLPLWKAARSLGTSETAAAEEKAGLVQQIKSTLTAEQWQAIQGMNLSMQDMSASALGLGGQAAPASAAAGSSAQAAGQGMPGDMPADAGAGGPPPGEMGGPAIQASSQSSQSQGAATGSFMGLNSALLDEIIKFLEAITGTS